MKDGPSLASALFLVSVWLLIGLSEAGIMH